jgi:membrane dipeptidase
MKALFRCIVLIDILLAFELLTFAQAEFLSVHNEAIVIDTHTDTPMQLIDAGFDIADRHEAPDYRVDIPRLQEGGVDAIFFALYTGQRKLTSENYREAYNIANRMLDSTLNAIEKNQSKLELAVSAEDIERISKTNKTAICLGLENGFPIARDISKVEEFYNRGVRYMTLCHTSDNDICDSSTDKVDKEDNGLSDFGQEVVKKMNQLGMIVDVSHISDKSFFEVLSLTNSPVIASHSSVRALCNHPRNLSDKMILALAANGGVIQICLLGDYITPADPNSINHKKLQELKKKYNNWQYRDENERREAWRAYDSINKHFPPVLPDISDAVNHIDHVVKIAGIDYVGIGSDFDGGGGLADCADVSKYPAITAELIRRGYNQQDINKIWGGNFLRVFREVEKKRGYRL